jgi:hypothetical protein
MSCTTGKLKVTELSQIVRRHLLSLLQDGLHLISRAWAWGPSAFNSCGAAVAVSTAPLHFKLAALRPGESPYPSNFRLHVVEEAAAVSCAKGGGAAAEGSAGAAALNDDRSDVPNSNATMIWSLIIGNKHQLSAFASDKTEDRLEGRGTNTRTPGSAMLVKLN